MKLVSFVSAGCPGYVRDWQRHTGQYLAGNSFAGTGIGVLRNPVVAEAA